MFYGRVDVYWPDGPIESYRLNKPTIAIGRSTGNDIVLDTTAISRYHIALTFTNQQMVLEDLDSVNGTYVDSVRLAPREPHVLRGGEEIQIGDIRVIFHPPSEALSLSEDTTQRMVLSQPTYRLELEGPDMDVAPGAYVQAALKIENLSDKTDRYFVEIDGLPKGWVRVDRVEMELEPGEQGQAMISFKPLRRSESQPGEHPFVVRVRSKSQPSQTIDAPTMLRVLPFSGFGMALGAPQTDQNGTFQLYLHNQGNAPLPLTIQGTDRDQRLRFDLPQTRLVLGPGERQTLTGSVRPRRRTWLGQDREIEFAILARSNDQAGFLAAVPGTVMDRGALPPWAPVLAIPLLALVVLLVVGTALLLLGDDDDDQPALPPVIGTFTVSSPAVVVGEPVDVTWQVSDADALDLVVQRRESQQRVPLEPDATAYSLSFEETGVVALVLEAHNGDAVATSTLQVEVRPVVSLTLEVVDGTELVHFVQHDVQISWDVLGAREFDGQYSIWLESSDAAALDLAAPQPLTNAITLPVVPAGEQVEWLVTLYAEGQDNVTATVTQKLPIVYPSCELSAARTVVRSGPGEAYPALVPPLESSSEGNLSFSPTAQDPSGTWFQVTIGVDNPRQGWVRRDDFTCANFDPDRLIATNDFPPPPEIVTPTATASPPPTSTPVTPASVTASPAPTSAPVTADSTPAP